MKRFWFSFLAVVLLVSTLAIAAGVQRVSAQAGQFDFFLDILAQDEFKTPCRELCTGRAFSKG